MTGLNYTAGDFFYYLAISLSIDTTLAALFRMCVFLSPSVVLAEVGSMTAAVSASCCSPPKDDWWQV